MTTYIPFIKKPPLVAVIRLSGVIASGARGQLNDATLAPVIERAFHRGKPQAVALVINSPGGSPVQSSLITARIRRLAAEKELPVFAFVEDVAASGGYWLATAADEIYADESSILGSIGVISASFGLTGLIEKIGVERRVYTAGKSKSMLDPFQPERPSDIKRLKALQEDIHSAFKTQVATRRKGKLERGADLFNGDIWLGDEAFELGLIDGIGHVVPKMKEKFGDKARFRVHGPRRPFISRFGLQLGSDAITAIEERAEYARFGL
ncbi:S49 family peptidase [Aliiroseovarius sp. S1339]|uniref:S49 family peptidase n=1 Tax=Aliiroseovarius sp. S1339 TaxID=2936990 RepID=UPI0020BE647F|nr:S49 family peptidase [Aliiroseovarius sp. S1339]MCK8464332.1 S49 family peptidase [Aliiroseovarius sp. S1339]